MKRRNFAQRLGCAVEATLDLIDILKAWGEGHQARLACAPVPGTIKAPHRAA